jgi:hypothetical protein
MLTVADELAFDALADETRTLCEKIIASKVEDAEDEAESAYEDGFRAGNTDRDGTMAEAEREKLRLAGYVNALEDQLKHHGLKPDRQFGIPPEQRAPTIDPSQLAAKPKTKRGKDGDDFLRPLGAQPS